MSLILKLYIKLFLIEPIYIDFKQVFSFLNFGFHLVIKRVEKGNFASFNCDFVR
jgi:hypothetical protein